MKKPKILSSSENIDIKQLSLDIIRDLFAASRKFMMYALERPAAVETVQKPLASLNEIFRYKRSFVIKSYNNRLTAEGILLDDNITAKGLLEASVRHGLNTVEFKANLSASDLFNFLRTMIQTSSPTDNYIEKSLVKQGITSIVINSNQAKTLFDIEKTIIGSGETVFDLDTYLTEILAAKYDAIVEYYQGQVIGDDKVESCFDIDIRYAVIKRYVPAIIAAMSEKSALELFQKAIYSTSWLGTTIDDSHLECINKLWRDYAIDKPNPPILMQLYDIFKMVGATQQVVEKVFDRGAIVKFKTVRDAEEIIAYLKAGQIEEIDFDRLHKLVQKLAAETNNAALEQLLHQLLRGILSVGKENRQRCLRLTVESLNALAEGAFWDIRYNFVKEAMKAVLKPNSGDEIIELIGWIAGDSAAQGRWDELKICCQALKGIANDSKDSRSDRAKAKLNEMSQSSLLTDTIVEAILSGKGDRSSVEALAALGSPLAVERLLNRIDGEGKAIRARVIKTLSAMGRGVGPEVTARVAQIVGAGESLEDRPYFKLRNLLRVIGQINYIEALPYLEVMAGWNQKRIKYEVISSCGYMKSPAIGTILMKLALDKDADIRKSATITMGQTGHPDLAKFLNNIFPNPRSEKVLIVEALGRIKGPSARDILINLYENENLYAASGISKKDEEQIRAGIIGALKNIGDVVSLSKARLYDSQPTGGFDLKKVISKTASLLFSDGKK